MSVVNKMLKDLENRSASPTSTANYQPPAKKSNPALRIGFILLVGLVAVGLVYFWPAPVNGPLPSSPSIGPINQMSHQPVSNPVKTEEPAEQATVAVNNDPPSDVSGPLTSEPALRSEDAVEQIHREPASVELTTGHEAEVATNSEPAAISAQPQVTLDASAEPSMMEDAVAEPVKKSSTVDPEETLKVQIREAISKNDTSNAIRLLTILIRQQPDNVAARKRLAALYFSAGRTTDAQQLLQRSVADMPADSSVRLMYARLLVQQNETKLAYYTLQDINDFAQPSIELLGYRASLAQQLSLFDDALKDYAMLVRLDAQTAKWWLGQAVVADKQGYTALAIESYREALSLHQLESGIEQFIRQRLTNLTGVSS